MSLTPEQLENRLSGIGGSDMAAVLGIDPWRQPIDVFFEKRPDLAAEDGYIANIVDENENEAVMWGNILEAGIAEGYARRTGRRVQRSNISHRHESAPLVAHIDRRVVGEKRGVEIKNVSSRMVFKWGPSGSDEVAEYYLPQVMHYMLTMDWPTWDVAALIGGSELRIYTIERDREWDEIILDASTDFWRRVEAGDPPPINPDHARAMEVIKRVHSGTDGSVIQLDDSFSQWAAVMQDAKAFAKKYGDVAETAKAHILSAMGNAAIAKLPNGTGFTRKKVERGGYAVEPISYIDFRFSKNLK